MPLAFDIEYSSILGDKACSLSSFWAIRMFECRHSFAPLEQTSRTLRLSFLTVDVGSILTKQRGFLRTWLILGS